MGNLKQERLTQAQLAKRLMITDRQVRNLFDRGLPKHGYRKASYCVWEEVFPWFLAYKLAQVQPKQGLKNDDFAAAETRKMIAEADLKEMVLAQKRAELAPIADFELAHLQMCGTIRSRALSLAPKLAPAVAGMTHVPSIKAKIEDEVREMLVELSNTAGVVHFPEDELEGVAAGA